MTSKNKFLPEYWTRPRSLPQPMIDHADLSVGDWSICGKGHEVKDFLKKLGGIKLPTHGEAEVRALQAPKVSENGRTFRADISTGHDKGCEIPIRVITRGELSHAFGEYRVPVDARDYIRLGLEAGLNLNHWILAQRFKRLWRPGNPIIHRPRRVAALGTPVSYEGEFSLNGATNWLIGFPVIIDYALSKNAEDHLMDCLETIEEIFDAQLSSIAHYCDGVTIVRENYYSIKKIEFYWEFAAVDPIHLVESLDVHLRGHGEEWRRSIMQIEDPRFEVYQDSPCVKVRLSGGCELAVYAKTNKRVRFEIRMNSDAINSIFKNKSEAGRTTHKKAEFHRMVAKLREAATGTFETFLARLDRQFAPPMSDVTPWKLCGEIGGLLGDGDLAHTVIEALRLTGRLAPTPGSPLAIAAKVLAKPNVGILARLAPRSPVFVPCNRYLSAVQGLRGFVTH